MKNRSDKLKRVLLIIGITVAAMVFAVDVGDKVGFFVAEFIGVVALCAMLLIWFSTTEEKARVSAEKERHVV
ncbi:MAG: hypothetical protein HYS44_00540 [Candidatus Niyogibacteria bacterium]|nr:hypothetical protein [Candidatus Niyogibacteria bacterium]